MESLPYKTEQYFIHYGDGSIFLPLKMDQYSLPYKTEQYFIHFGVGSIFFTFDDGTILFTLQDGAVFLPLKMEPFFLPSDMDPNFFYLYLPYNTEPYSFFWLRRWSLNFPLKMMPIFFTFRDELYFFFLLLDVRGLSQPFFYLQGRFFVFPFSFLNFADETVSLYLAIYIWIRTLKISKIWQRMNSIYELYIDIICVTLESSIHGSRESAFNCYFYLIFLQLWIQVLYCKMLLNTNVREHFFFNSILHFFFYYHTRQIFPVIISQTCFAICIDVDSGANFQSLSCCLN